MTGFLQLALIGLLVSSAPELSTFDLSDGGVFDFGTLQALENKDKNTKITILKNICIEFLHLCANPQTYEE